MSNHHPDFNLGHIQPTPMFGSVVNLQPFGDAPRFGRFKFLTSGWWVFIELTDELALAYTVTHVEEYVGRFGEQRRRWLDIECTREAQTR